MKTRKSSKVYTTFYYKNKNYKNYKNYKNKNYNIVCNNSLLV